MRAIVLILTLLALAVPAAAQKVYGVWIETMPDGCKALYEQEFKSIVPDDAEVKTTWSGACKDGKTEGEGVLEQHVNGTMRVRYEGTLVAGRAEGKGVSLYGPFHRQLEGLRYEGAFKDGKANGAGVMQTGRGDRYEGGWKDGRMNGAGHFTWANGDSFKGNFVAQLAHGAGDCLRFGKTGRCQYSNGRFVRWLE